MLEYMKNHMGKKVSLNSYLTPYAKMNLRWNKDINKKPSFQRKTKNISVT